MELLSDQVTYLERDKVVDYISGTNKGEILAKGGIVQLVIGKEIYTAIVEPGQTTWKIDLPAALLDGSYSVSIVNIDKSGNASKPLLVTLVVDTQGPLTPILLNLFDDAGSETGSFDANKSTDDARPELTGVAGKFDIVLLKNGDVVIGSAQADENGIWKLTPEQDLNVGENILTLVAQDTFAKKPRESVASEPFTIILEDDALPPGTARIDDVIDNFGIWTGSLTSGALTDDATPTFQGQVAPGSTLLIRYRLEGSDWGSTTVTTTGKSWSWTPASDLAAGNWEFQINAGNGWSNSFALEIADISNGGSEALNATLTHALDDVGPFTGILKSGAITDDAMPTLEGRAEANSTVIISYGQKGIFNQTASVVVGSDGNWKWTPPADLALDSWSFRAQTSGNTSWSDTLELKIIDATIEKPVLQDVWDDVILNIGTVADNGMTNDNQPTLSGQAQANSILSIYDNGVLLSTVMVDSSGKWELITPVLADDTHKLSLAYGAYDALAPTWTIIVDTVPPESPGIDSIAVNVSYADIIAMEQKEMFINDDKFQYKIDGKAGDVLTLDNLAPEEWAAQGQVTVAGVQYDVWGHEAGDAELLVQQGIQTSLNG